MGEVITIPTGWFLMGNGGEDEYGKLKEFPQYRVHLSTYQIGKYEVTRGEYRKFMEAGGYENPDPFDHKGFHFVRGGCWDDGPGLSIRCSYRQWYLPSSSAGVGPGDSDYIGFRVAR